MLNTEEHKAKIARNRASSPAILLSHGITFVSKNAGVHLIVSHNGKVVDFWPGTGKWIGRGNGAAVGRGVFNLIRELEERCTTYSRCDGA